MTVKITSPIEGYTGRSTFGPFNTTFDKGVAVLPEINEGLEAYLKSRGYTVETETPADDTPADDLLSKNTNDVLAGVQGMSLDEVRQVIEDEKAGRARKGLLEGLAKVEQSLVDAQTPNPSEGGEEQ